MADDSLHPDETPEQQRYATPQKGVITSGLTEVSSEKLAEITSTFTKIAEGLILRGQQVSMDKWGMICLGDIHKAAGAPRSQGPHEWTRLKTTQGRINRVSNLNTRFSRNKEISGLKSAIYTKCGKGGGTFADARLALDYAEYLNPGLAIEVKEVFLRHKSGDETLADETLQRSTAKGNEWAATRALGRAKRHQFTETLKDHEVVNFGYADCTNAVYKELLGGTKKQVIAMRDLPKNVNLRDAIPTNELIYVMMAEALASERIDHENPRGNGPCAKATARSASFVKQAIDLDRKDRQKGLPH